MTPVSTSPIYREHHPKWLRSRTSTWWWLEKWAFVKFILRELSSVFVAWFVVYLLLLFRAVRDGNAAYQNFLAFSANPIVLTVNVVTLFFIVFHALTWFALAPRAMVVHVGKKKVPPFLIGVGNYGGWIVVSAVIFWFLLR